MLEQVETVPLTAQEQGCDQLAPVLQTVRKPWQFQPGICPNPKGRGKGNRNWINRLDSSIAIVQRRAKKKVLEHFVERALLDDSVLNKLADKILPNASPDRDGSSASAATVNIILFQPPASMEVISPC